MDACILILISIGLACKYYSMLADKPDHAKLTLVEALAVLTLWLHHH